MDEIARDVASAGYAGSSFVAEFYEHVPRYRTRDDVGFYVDAARNADGRVLELGCGTGRLLIPMARTGVQVTGVDVAPEMLAVCRRHLEREPESVRACVSELVQADVRVFEAHGLYALVIAPFRLLQFLTTVSDQLKVLKAVRALLAPGGRFVFDLFDFSLLDLPDVGVEFGEEPPFTLPDGRIVLRRKEVTAWDIPGQTLRTRSIFHVTHPDGTQRRLVHEHQVRYLFRFEIEHLLARAALRVVECYGDFAFTPYGDRYPGDIVVIAQTDPDA